MVLGAAEREDPLEVAGPAAVHELRDPGRADEGDGRDARMVTDRLDHLAPAVHHVEDAGRQPRLRQQLRDAAGAERHQLGGLEHHAVAEGDRVGDRPVRHHAREVERRRWRRRRRPDGGRCGTRRRGSPPAPRRSRSAAASRRTRSARSPWRSPPPPRARVLPCSSRDQRGQLVDVALEQRPVAVEDLDPLLDRPGRPGGKRLRRRPAPRRRARRSKRGRPGRARSPSLGFSTSSSWPVPGTKRPPM